jgi:plasmid stabilization system protein ParE
MSRFRVRVAPVVREQILEHARHIALDSIDNALAWEDRLRAKLRELGDFAHYAVDEAASERLGQVVRKVSFEGTYLIHFRIDEAQRIVDVLSFRHGARLPRPGEP